PGWEARYPGIVRQASDSLAWNASIVVCRCWHDHANFKPASALGADLLPTIRSNGSHPNRHRTDRLCPIGHGQRYVAWAACKDREARMNQDGDSDQVQPGFGRPQRRNGTRPLASTACRQRAQMPRSGSTESLALEFPPGSKPAALDNSTTHATPQAVNRTGTTPCCKLRNRSSISRRSRPLLASRGRSRIASRDEKRSDRRKVWVCFRWCSWM